LGLGHVKTPNNRKIPEVGSTQRCLRVGPSEIHAALARRFAEAEIDRWYIKEFGIKTELTKTARELP
jgi:hypothetical protein